MQLTLVGVVGGVGVQATDQLRVVVYLVDPAADLFHLKCVLFTINLQIILILFCHSNLLNNYNLKTNILQIIASKIMYFVQNFNWKQIIKSSIKTRQHYTIHFKLDLLFKYFLQNIAQRLIS